MTDIHRAHTTDEYVDLVKQVVFEAVDHHACLEWGNGHDALATRRTTPFLEPLSAGVRDLQQSMAQGRYNFATGEPAFMELPREYPGQLPFAPLLERINVTHREGLDVDPG